MPPEVEHSAPEKKVEEIAHALHVEMPEGDLPYPLNLIALFTLIGGLSILGGLFVDIGGPSGSVETRFYVLRLGVGVLAVFTAYGLVKKERWALWLYGVIGCIGLYFNSVSAVVPLLALWYLYLKRTEFRPSVLDMLLGRAILRGKEKAEAFLKRSSEISG